MMEINDTFYMAQAGTRKILVSTEEEAIEILKKNAKKDSSISKVSIKGDKWKISQLFRGKGLQNDT